MNRRTVDSRGPEVVASGAASASLLPSLDKPPARCPSAISAASQGSRPMHCEAILVRSTSAWNVVHSSSRQFTPPLLAVKGGAKDPRIPVGGEELS